MKLTDSNVLARKYLASGQVCAELIITDDGRYLIAENGTVQDARQVLSLEEARAFFDEAPYQLGSRPTHDKRSQQV
jgi:hypothetical protein